MLATNPYVVVIALDFSKAFDTVRQANLLRKIALLNIPDPVYNWLVEFFSDHTHCTRFNVSGFQRITASIIYTGVHCWPSLLRHQRVRLVYGDSW